MGTKKKRGKLGSSLFGKTRQAVLALFFRQPDLSFYMRQVVRLVGTGQGTVQRELKQLTDAGIIEKKQQGRQVYYRANKSCPIFPELRGLIIKTFGLADILKDALKPLSKKIKAAFIYGSVAANSAKTDSDVDLMVIGSCSFAEVVDAMHKAQEKIGREINPTVYSIKEWNEKLKNKHHFVTSVSKSTKLFVTGTQHDMEGLA